MKRALAEKIDAWVIGVVSNGGGDEQLLEGMYDYMDTFEPARCPALAKARVQYRLAQVTVLVLQVNQ
jgi:hypothetical protein